MGAQQRKVLMQVAAVHPRNFVVMEVKGNLNKDDRAKNLAQFKTPVFKTVADVLVGEPPTSFKKLAHARTLKAKQIASDTLFKAKKIDEKRQWLLRKKRKELEKAKEKAEKER